MAGCEEMKWYVTVWKFRGCMLRLTFGEGRERGEEFERRSGLLLLRGTGSCRRFTQGDRSLSLVACFLPAASVGNAKHTLPVT